jgi:hypothetical protein
MSDSEGEYQDSLAGLDIDWDAIPALAAPSSSAHGAGSDQYEFDEVVDEQYLAMVDAAEREALAEMEGAGSRVSGVYACF